MPSLFVYAAVSALAKPLAARGDAGRGVVLPLASVEAVGLGALRGVLPWPGVVGGDGVVLALLAKRRS